MEGRPVPEYSTEFCPFLSTFHSSESSPLQNIPSHSLLFYTNFTYLCLILVCAYNVSLWISKSDLFSSLSVSNPVWHRIVHSDLRRYSTNVSLEGQQKYIYQIGRCQINIQYKIRVLNWKNLPFCQGSPGLSTELSWAFILGEIVRKPMRKSPLGLLNILRIYLTQ